MRGASVCLMSACLLVHPLVASGESPGLALRADHGAALQPRRAAALYREIAVPQLSLAARRIRSVTASGRSN